MVNKQGMAILVDELQLMDSESYERAVNQTAEMLPTIYKQLGMDNGMSNIVKNMETNLLLSDSDDTRISQFKRESVIMFVNDVQKKINGGN